MNNPSVCRIFAHNWSSTRYYTLYSLCCLDDVVLITHNHKNVNSSWQYATIFSTTSMDLVTWELFLPLRHKYIVLYCYRVHCNKNREENNRLSKWKFINTVTQNNVFWIWLTSHLSLASSVDINYLNQCICLSIIYQSAIQDNMFVKKRFLTLPKKAIILYIAMSVVNHISSSEQQFTSSSPAPMPYECPKQFADYWSFDMNNSPEHLAVTCIAETNKLVHPVDTLPISILSIKMFCHSKKGHWRSTTRIFVSIKEYR